MRICECCSNKDWKIIDKNWVRCESCGRLETRIRKRDCIECGRPIGKYATSNKVICNVCKKIRTKYKPKKLCKTTGCNKITYSTKKYCKQCKKEKETWIVPDGHLWKSQAIKLLSLPTNRNALLKQLKQIYPDILKETLYNWLSRQAKIGEIERIKYGIYQAINKNAKLVKVEQSIENEILVNIIKSQ